MGLKDESKELNILFVEVKLKNVPLLIFANNQDLVQALPTDEASIPSIQDLRQFEIKQNH
ncbi:unnamed protein product [Paramecium octaurelia]|uniref:Uncharacterized protein n=1 Tax=Paramecium octaurelia TaxID=43137 RepID=A0A8S1YR12_PAROT|nr:unnamed protein product [Paramecium octaurelia]